MSNEEDRQQWTPSTEQVRSHYVFNQSDEWDPKRGEAFDRWLASVRTPAPAPDVQALIDEAREVDGYESSFGLNGLVRRLADALEAAIPRTLSEAQAVMTAYHLAQSTGMSVEQVVTTLREIGTPAASTSQVTDAMVEAAYKAALENGAGQLWKADVRAALEAALGARE